MTPAPGRAPARPGLPDGRTAGHRAQALLTVRGVALGVLAAAVALLAHVLDRTGALPFVHESEAVRRAVLAPADGVLLPAWLALALGLGVAVEVVLRRPSGRARALPVALLLAGGGTVLFAVPEVLGRYDAGVALLGEGLGSALLAQVLLVGTVLLTAVLLRLGVPGPGPGLHRPCSTRPADRSAQLVSAPPRRARGRGPPARPALGLRTAPPSR